MKEQMKTKTFWVVVAAGLLVAGMGVFFLWQDYGNPRDWKPVDDAGASIPDEGTYMVAGVDEDNYGRVVYRMNMVTGVATYVCGEPWRKVADPELKARLGYDVLFYRSVAVVPCTGKYEAMIRAGPAEIP